MNLKFQKLKYSLGRKMVKKKKNIFLIIIFVPVGRLNQLSFICQYEVL